MTDYDRVVLENRLLRKKLESIEIIFHNIKTMHNMIVKNFYSLDDIQLEIVALLSKDKNDKSVS